MDIDFSKKSTDDFHSPSDASTDPVFSILETRHRPALGFAIIP